ncbi:YdcF family protein [Oceanobacillus chungangensis]|uniref:YdcF family protein n=1 Tax=Oceanobacillus chungangensis TaxID=1229152 RepID=A0A3D8PZJ4_9BACI|nr:YdcF family protein [Oceanobacillus chungangensis]RDW20758.1 YdcF family protein [Oceanobacillus chungangensis]
MKLIKKLTCIVTLLICFYFLLILGREFLIVNEKPKKVDAIIVLSGEMGRLEKAAELFREGYAEFLMLSNSSVLGTTIQEATDLGIPYNKIISEEEATSTYTNALYTKKEMEKNNLKSAIVVSSDFHMRRSKLIFDRLYKGTGIELTYVASPSMERTWLTEESERNLVFREWTKLIGYWLHMYKFTED